jgi:hypothetical protein
MPQFTQGVLAKLCGYHFKSVDQNKRPVIVIGTTYSVKIQFALRPRRGGQPILMGS